MMESNFSIYEIMCLVGKQDPMEGYGFEYFEELNLSISTKPSKNSYQKWKFNTKDLDTINRHLKDNKELSIGKEDHLTKSEIL